jgi:hypothetical protein
LRRMPESIPNENWIPDLRYATSGMTNTFAYWELQTWYFLPETILAFAFHLKLAT